MIKKLFKKIKLWWVRRSWKPDPNSALAPGIQWMSVEWEIMNEEKQVADSGTIDEFPDSLRKHIDDSKINPKDIFKDWP